MGLPRQPEHFSDEVVESRGDVVAAVATAKRRRGWPPGSKNRPKPPVVVSREAPPETSSAAAAAAMRPHVLEIPGGGDVAGALAGFARRLGLGICVLAGTGAVANVTLRHPSSAAEITGGGAAAAAVVVFHGRYDILSISATFLPPSMSAAATAPALRALTCAGGVSISLAGPHGQIVGSAVAGPLVAATTVVVVAAAFAAPTFHRLPAGDDDDEAPAPVSVSGSGGGEADEHHHHLTALRPHGMSPATKTTQPVLYAPACQREDVWGSPAASAPRPRPPYQ